MADTYDILVVAYYLSILTFYTGVLIYSLPVPWRGLKAWGPRLIGDSIFTIVLLTSYLALVKSTDFMLGLLGGSWSSFWAWVSSAVSFAAALKGFIFALLAASKALDASWAVSTLTWPVDRAANLVILVVATLSGLGWLVSTYRDTFMALGIALMSIPLRLGRGAGAWLLAFTVVFYIGLPMLPAFTAWIVGEAAPRESLGFAIARVSVADYSGESVDYGVVAFSTIPGGDPVSLYPIIGGVVQGKLGPGYASFPDNTSIYATLEVDGVQLPLAPYPFTPGSLSPGKTLNLTAVNMVYSDGLLVLFTSSSRVSAALAGKQGNVTVHAWAPQPFYIEVRYPDTCSVAVSHNAARIESGSWDWRGVKGRYLRLYSNGSLTATITYSGGCSPQFNPPEARDYVLDSKGLELLINPKIVVDLILYYITVPIMYNFTLASIAYALARVLGGRDRIMPRFI